jgi:hypothetical protein
MSIIAKSFNSKILLNPEESKKPTIITEELWTDKYKPKHSSKLSGSTKSINLVRSWLLDWEANKKKSLKILSTKTSKRKSKTDVKLPYSCMLVHGIKGIGKTTTVELVVNECKYQIYNLDKEILKDMKQIRETINNITKINNITDMMKNKTSKNIVVVIDNLENIKVSVEKKNLKALQKENDAKWIVPIIFISDSQHNKLKSAFVKLCETVIIFTPFENTMHNIMTDIMKDNNQMFKGKEAADLIIDHAQFDIRRLINTLQELYKIYGKNQMTLKNINEYIVISKKKDQDVGLFEANGQLLYEYSDMNKCISLFETDKVLVPLMMYQNYKKAIILKSAHENISQYDSLKTMLEIADALSIADIEENEIYSSQNWDIQQNHGFHSCVLPSYIMNRKSSNVNYGTYNFEFAEDFNKTLIKNINRKMIFNTNEAFPNMGINDFMFVDKILKYLISTDNIKLCKTLLKGYGAKIENIESLLKIVKIKKGIDEKEKKANLSSKHKTQFKKYL